MNIQVKTSLAGLIAAGLSFFSCSRAYNQTMGHHTKAVYQVRVTHSSYNPAFRHVMTPILMPYNRYLTPAGKSYEFGNPDLENHALDATLLPGDSLIAIEHRYGISVFNINRRKFLQDLNYEQIPGLEHAMSTYSGITHYSYKDSTFIMWTAAEGSHSYLLKAYWNQHFMAIAARYPFSANPPAPNALANDVKIRIEQGIPFAYVVLNGNNSLVKLNTLNGSIVYRAQTGEAPYGLALAGSKVYVSNWGGPVPEDNSRETAGIPWGSIYINPQTGASLEGTVSVFDAASGKNLKQIQVGLHPNSIISSMDHSKIFVANGNSDNVSEIDTTLDQTVGTIPVHLDTAADSYIGDSPNALAISTDDQSLYVSNGLDNAIAIIHLPGRPADTGNLPTLAGFIPTEAYPAGLCITPTSLIVCNLEGTGSHAHSLTVHDASFTTKYTTPSIPTGAYFNAHHERASISVIPLPGNNQLDVYSKQVRQNNLLYREELSRIVPRAGMAPVPVPKRIGEPSVFRHVVYIIKENRTYDQVLGDMPEGNGAPQLCAFGRMITPNQHALAQSFELMDHYYASGKSSAEGHQWTDAGMVTDYIEKNVRAWFRSYPHVQNDAMVYDQEGFIWNHALDFGKSVRIYGEAATPHWSGHLDWSAIYQLFLQDKPFHFTNTSTISRVIPLLSPLYPGYDGHNVTDQLRAKGFIEELHQFEALPGDQWPQLMILALPADHTAGLRPGFPTPASMVADNDLALGKIVDAISHSRFWDSTAIFVTEDDSQDGWDHVSAYRTTGFVISPYSRLKKPIHTAYNQTSMLRTIEQILGLPPMNVIDATATPMFACFEPRMNPKPYDYLQNQIPLDQMNKPISDLKGMAKRMALASAKPEFDHIDGGNDDLLNRIIWFASMGTKPYPSMMHGTHESSNP